MSQAVIGLDARSREREQDRHAGHALDSIRNALRGLRFGTVSVVVQDGVVVQVERTEKLRLLRRDAVQ